MRGLPWQYFPRSLLHQRMHLACYSYGCQWACFMNWAYLCVKCHHPGQIMELMFPSLTRWWESSISTPQLRVSNWMKILADLSISLVQGRGTPGCWRFAGNNCCWKLILWFLIGWCPRKSCRWFLNQLKKFALNRFPAAILNGSVSWSIWC